MQLVARSQRLYTGLAPQVGIQVPVVSHHAYFKHDSRVVIRGWWRRRVQAGRRIGFGDMHEALLELAAFGLENHFRGKRRRPDQGPAVDQYAVTLAIELQGTPHGAGHLPGVAFNFDFEVGDGVEVVEVPDG